jgi:Ca-activated chloride channel family protein
VSFASPLVLLALLAVPLLVAGYILSQRGRERASTTFATKPLQPSVAPRRPRWRRHAPMLAFLLAVAVLIIAAARPQRSSAVPVTQGAVMLVQDVSSSMASTDVTPSRLGAAERASQQFLRSVPDTVKVGLMQFNEKPTLLQSPTTDHSLASSALTQLHAGGHTAIGDAIEAATAVLKKTPGLNGKRAPSAIVLLSDGTSTNGANPIVVARQVGAQHIPVYTVALGTARGTIKVKHGKRTLTVPVPLSATELGQIAKVSGGRAFTVGDSGKLKAVYTHLASQLGHKHVNHEITQSFAGLGLVLLIFGSAMSLRWFGRLA